MWGYFFLHPLDYKDLGKHSLASLTFISNFVYWKESNYFDTSSLEKWLLHTWSLSVEWQFYLIYPVVLLLCKRLLSSFRLKFLILIAFIFCFFFSIVITYKSSSAAYYLLPTRAWQMLVGGIVFLFPLTIASKSLKEFLHWAGIGFIVASFFIFDSSTPWPGFAALIPILGVYLVLVSEKNHSFFIDNKIVQKLGTWSYSIYLWHWPIAVYGYLFVGSKYWYIVGLPLSIVLGALSYRFIESKRSNNFLSVKHFLRLSALKTGIIVALLSTLVFISDGISKRLSYEETAIAQEVKAAEGDWEYPQPNLYIEDLKIRFVEGSSEKNILFIGASHIEQLYPYVSNIDTEYNIYFLSAGGCFVTPSAKNPKWSCENIQNYIHLLSRVNFQKIVTSFYSFNSYLPTAELARTEEVEKRVNEFDSFLKTIKSHSDEVYLILGEPKGAAFRPRNAIRGDSTLAAVSVERVLENYKLHERALSSLTELAGVNIIDPITSLCSDGKCRTRTEDFKFYYKDANHMRPWYVKKHAVYPKQIFD
nr:acyltransferase family protein [Alteromonas sp.]